MRNVIVTPHAGFFSEEAVVELRAAAAMEVRKVLTGQQPAHPVNLGYRQKRDDSAVFLS